MKEFNIRTFLQNFLFFFNRHTPKEKVNVLLFSLPRSGSTWLQELIWTQPEFKYANEPLNLKGKYWQKKSKINGFSELYTERARQKVITYFKRIADGKLHFLDPSPLREFYRYKTSRVVFKVIHGGEVFINDIAKVTNSKVVYLVRHPIAVALSRKQLPRTKELTSDFVLSRFSTEEQRYAKKIVKQGSKMEKLILMWCIQNKLALQQRNQDWLIISYESLTCEPENILQELALHCDLPNLDKMLQRIAIPSAVTTQSDQDSLTMMKNTAEQRKSLISKWRNKVSEQEKIKYFEICKKMNFDIYKEDSDLPEINFIA